MKNETASVAIKKFVGLKPKMYSFLVNNEHIKHIVLFFSVVRTAFLSSV